MDFFVVVASGDATVLIGCETQKKIKKGKSWYDAMYFVWMAAAEKRKKKSVLIALRSCE